MEPAPAVDHHSRKLQLVWIHVCTFVPIIMLVVWLFTSFKNVPTPDGVIVDQSGLKLRFSDCDSAANQNDCYYTVFNWHPFLTFFGVVSTLSHGVLTFQTLQKAYGLSADTAKLVHAAFQTLAWILITIGFVAVINYKNFGDSAHFWSPHAWIGLGVYILITAQWFLGVVIFFLNPSLKVRKFFKPWHVIMGIASLVFGLVAIVSGFTSRLWIWFFFNGFTDDSKWPTFEVVRVGGVTLIFAMISTFAVISIFIHQPVHHPHPHIIHADEEENKEQYHALEQ